MPTHLLLLLFLLLLRYSRLNVNAVADSSVNCPLDIVFVIDQSSSVGKLQLYMMQRLASEFIGELDARGVNIRVGLVTFASGVKRKVFDMNTYTNVSEIREAIWSLKISRGTTRAHYVLLYVRTAMLTPEAGDRPDVPNVVILLSDGYWSDRTETIVSIN